MSRAPAILKDCFAPVLAPNGRDGEVAALLLADAGVASNVCSNVGQFAAALGEDTCFAVVAEEALVRADLRAIAERLAAQPTWSDIAFIILTRRGGEPERHPEARLSEVLGNVTLLERPFHPATFASIVRGALSGRRRQYEARDRIEALSESEQRLQTALVAGRLGSWELDLATMRLTTTATCKRCFGRGPDDEFTYEDLKASIHPDDLVRMQDAVRECIEKGSDYLIEYRNIWPDGSEHWVDIRARMVPGAANRNARLVGVSSDITQRKRTEARINLLNETLEQRVAQRTAEVEVAHRAILSEMAQRERAEEHLRQSQKMEMIGQLTGGVAHDFNNLLMAVLGNLELLQKRELSDPRSVRLIAGAMQGAQRGAALTQRLLAFARRQDLHVEPVDLRTLVNGMTDLLERSAGSRTEIKIDLPDNVPTVLGDGNQLELALLNLVVNARDAMPDGGAVTISARAVRGAPDEALSAGSYVGLTVADTGSGMTAQTLAKAIEPFFSTKGVGKGTGLGLSMIQGLATQLNGAFKLASKVGRGTQATLWLPVSGDVAAPKLAAPAAADVASVPAKILLVDDDPLIATSTMGMLEDLGHEVIEANSGPDALTILLSGQAIDLLITDYAMPRMTGAELAVEAQALRPHLPILLATGFAELPANVTIELPRLAKPFNQEQLADEIRKVMLVHAEAAAR